MTSQGKSLKHGSQVPVIDTTSIVKSKEDTADSECQFGNDDYPIWLDPKLSKFVFGYDEAVNSPGAKPPRRASTALI
jgi:hypothetical protein